MKLFEYQAQKLLVNFTIPVPLGQLAITPEEASAIAAKNPGKSVIKAQVLTGGRGKAGGVKITSTPEEAKAAAENILKLRIKDNPVKSVLVTPAVEIKKEFYLSIVVNRSEKRIDCIACAEGGMEIEELAVKSPEKIFKVPVSREIFIEEKGLLKRLGEIFTPSLAGQVLQVVRKMHDLFVQNDCTLVEINPLVLDDTDQLIAIDAKIVIDDNSLFKHPELEKLKNPEEYSQDEIDAQKASLSFVSLEGNIGCMVNGAGLAMATMDLIKYYGGNPADFLDIGGSSNPQKVVNGLKILTRNKNVRAILLNIFGGITRCDDIANGFIEAEKEIDIKIPLVIRLIGTNDKEGRDILQKNGFIAHSELGEAVKAVIKEATLS